LKITRIAQSCFEIEQDGKSLYIDPYKIPEGKDKADIILITHPHLDHADGKSIERILRDGTAIICPASCKKIVASRRARGILPGEKLLLEGFTIAAVPAYNKTKFFHPRKKNWVGYIISAGGKSIYHAGDTDSIPEMASVGNPDVAMLPIGGTFTMGLDGSMDAIKSIMPALVIPMHEIKQNLSTFASMVQKLQLPVKVAILRPGESLSI